MDNISPLLPGGPLCGFLSGNLKSEPQTQALINLRQSREIFLSIRPSSTLSGASQVALVIKTPQETQETRIRSLVRKIPWRRAWQPTPVFLPGESHGQRSLVGCSLWGHKESGTTKCIAHMHAPHCQMNL